MYDYLFSEEENGEYYCMNLTQMDCCVRTVKCVWNRDHNKMESTGCTVKCDP